MPPRKKHAPNWPRRRARPRAHNPADRSVEASQAAPQAAGPGQRQFGNAVTANEAAIVDNAHPHGLRETPRPTASANIPTDPATGTETTDSPAACDDGTADPGELCPPDGPATVIMGLGTNATDIVLARLQAEDIVAGTSGEVAWFLDNGVGQVQKRGRRRVRFRRP